MTAAELEARLWRGEVMIVTAADDAERERLTDHWLRLLRAYEATWDAETADHERRWAA